MRKLLTILILSVGWLAGYAQTSKADSLQRTGLNHFSVNLDFKRAYQDYSRARELYHAEGEVRKELACLKCMAMICDQTDDYKQSVSHYESALGIAKSLNDQFEEYDIYSSLSDVYKKSNQQKLAMEMRTKVDSMVTNVPNTRIMFRRKIALTNEALQQGNIDLAEQYLTDAKNIYSQLSVQDWQNEKSLLDRTSQSLDSRKAHDDTLEAIKKEVVEDGDKDPTAYLDYASYAWQEAKSGNREKAKEAMVAMKKDLDKATNIPPLIWFYYYSFSGKIHDLFKEWNDACDDLQMALSVYEKANIQDDNSYYTIVYLLGSDLVRNGDYQAALHQRQRYSDYVKSRFGDKSLDYAVALHTLGDTQGLSGDIQSGIATYSKAVDIYRELIPEQFKYVSMSEREQFWNYYYKDIFGLAAYALKSGNTQDIYSRQGYNAILMWKGCLMEADRSVANAVYAKCTAEEQSVYLEIKKTQTQLKDLNRNFQQNKELISDLNTRLQSLYSQFTPIASKLDFSDFMRLDYEYVRNSLKDDEYVVDFIDYFSSDSVTVYAAFVYDKNQEFPRLLKIFNKEELDNIRMDAPSRMMYQQPLADKIVKLIFSPLSKYLPKGSTVYYVPSGEIHQIALETLPDSDGKLLGEHYNFIRLSSARELARRSDVVRLKQSDMIPNAVLYGGLKYDVDPVTMETEASEYKELPYFAILGEEMAQNGRAWPDLSSLKTEVDEVECILKSAGLKVKPFVGTKGTEESFMMLHQRAPQILMLVTHGFYYTPDAASKNEYLKGYTDAMSLSGLVLSGGNAAWKREKLPEGVLNGILSADEIAQMNLEGLDLVMLSACQTGQGQTTSGGIYGLQRAFKLAGAGTIIMTLWEANAAAAKDFVTFFFQELTENGWKKRDAFNKARDFVKETYKDPYYWACFVMLD